MKKFFLFKLLQSHYCKIVFLLSLLFGFLLIPKPVFSGFGFLVAGVFLFVFAINIACFVSNLKIKINNAIKQKISFLNIFLGIIGISAFQFCSLGAHICGAGMIASVFSVIFPGILINFLANFSIEIIILSILLQTISLYYSNCTERINNLNK